MGLWSWIGIAAAGWCAFSFTFAVWLGRTIRASEQALEYPPPRQRPDFSSGVQITTHETDGQVHELHSKREATGSHPH